MNYNITCKSIDQALNAQKMYELKQNAMIAALSGKYKDARRLEKEYAKFALSDFEACKNLPFVHFKVNSTKTFFSLFWQNLKYRIFKAFTRTTKEEKQLAKQYQEYLKTLTPTEIKAKTLDITIPSLYY